MKQMKKLASLLLALVMTLALSVSALAAGSNTITVKNAQANETYKIYKMLDLSVNDDKTAYTYTVNADWKDFFTGEGAGAAYVTITNGYVTWKANGDVAAFAKAAAKFAAENSVTAIGTKTPATDSDFTFEGLEPGYYLITSTNGTLAMTDTTPDKTAVEVNEKNPDSTIDKTVQEDSTGNYGGKNDADIGQTVNFQVTINVKKGAKNYVMHDQMTAGLTFNENSVNIAGLIKGTDYTVVTDNLGDGCTFHVVFTQAYLDTVTGDTQLTVEYSATLNENAKVGVAETNKAKLNWGDKSETVWKETETRTWEINVYKYTVIEATAEGEKDTEKALANAEFILYKDVKNGESTTRYYAKATTVEGGYRFTEWTENKADATTFVTPDTGKFAIKGLDSDTYYLEETTAPAGYNVLKAPVKVVIDNEGKVTYGNDNTAAAPDIKVLNQTGTELPSTGGMGTTIFYVLGSVLVVAAGVLLVTKKRMDSKA